MIIGNKLGQEASVPPTSPSLECRPPFSRRIDLAQKAGRGLLSMPSRSQPGDAFHRSEYLFSPTDRCASIRHKLLNLADMLLSCAHRELVDQPSSFASQGFPDLIAAAAPTVPWQLCHRSIILSYP